MLAKDRGEHRQAGGWAIKPRRQPFPVVFDLNQTFVAKIDQHSCAGRRRKRDEVRGLSPSCCCCTRHRSGDCFVITHGLRVRWLPLALKPRANHALSGIKPQFAASVRSGSDPCTSARPSRYDLCCRTHTDTAHTRQLIKTATASQSGKSTASFPNDGPIKGPCLPLYLRIICRIGSRSQFIESYLLAVRGLTFDKFLWREGCPKLRLVPKSQPRVPTSLGCARALAELNLRPGLSMRSGEYRQAAGAMQAGRRKVALPFSVGAMCPLSGDPPA